MYNKFQVVETAEVTNGFEVFEDLMELFIDYLALLSDVALFRLFVNEVRFMIISMDWRHEILENNVPILQQEIEEFNSAPVEQQRNSIAFI